MSGTTARRRVLRVPVAGTAVHRADLLAVEEPLEIRVDGEPLTVTMRTPGDDIDLAAGFLFTEGLLAGLGEVREIRMCDENTAAVTLGPGGALLRTASRNFMATSACGVCGKDSIEAIRVRSAFDVAADQVQVSPAVLAGLPDQLREAQRVFRSTGGLHAAGLFTADGTLLALREDVGRHNAVGPGCSPRTARCWRCARTWAATTRWTSWPAGRCAPACCPWPGTSCWSAGGPRSSWRRRRS